MTGRDFRYTADIARRWRRVALPLTSDANVNTFIDRLMRERPYGEAHGRASYAGPPIEGINGRWIDLARQPEVKEIASMEGMQITGHAPQGRRFKKGPERMAHGTISSYSNLRCRCDACREAWNAYNRKKYHERKRERELDSQH